MSTDTADVAIYARYSTDRQDARSIEDQMRRCRALAETRGFGVAAEHSDAAVSGSHTVRVNLQRLIADARRGAFKSVLVDDLSRLSRDLGDTWRIVFDDLASVGTKVIDVTTGMSSDAEGARVTFGALALVNDTFRPVARAAGEHVVKDIPALRLVPPELWEPAQQRFRSWSTSTKRAGRPPGSTREPSLLAGLLKCGTCGGSMAMVSRVKKAGAIYPSIGCNVYRSRGPAICPNNKTISEKKVRESVLGFVRETIARPDLIDRFIKHFEQHYAKLEKTAVTADLNDKIHEAEGRVRNLVDALSKMGWSESVATRLREEEERLTAVRARAVELGKARQKTIPHPRVIEGYLRNLQALLGGDRTRARMLLAKHVGRLVLTPGERGYEITGAFGLHLPVDGEVGPSVCDNSSSGGVI